MENYSSIVSVPDEDLDVSFEVTAEKPFNKCFACRSFRNGCSGPNLFAMGIERACEFLQMARIHIGYTYQDVSDATTVSIAQVKRILTGKVSDPSFFSMKALSDYLLGDPNGKYPCAIPDIAADSDSAIKLNHAIRDLERALNDNDDYRVALDNIHASYQSEMATLRIEHKEAMDEKDRDHQTIRDHLISQIEHQREDIIFLRSEIARRSVLIDEYMKTLLPKKDN